MIRFLADADLKHAIVKGCRRHEPSIDFLSAHEAGLRGIPDPEVLAFAAEQNRILVSHDLNTMPKHFKAFLAKHGSSPGVFLLSQSLPIGRAIEELIFVWAASDSDEWNNRIVNIPL